MSKINVLDSKVYNKISAGEVVEGATSVVKELVENALDAKADRIYVEIGQDISYIKVVDNGFGIEKDDLKKVFLPHATSKIKNAEDLAHIVSLGFRGEAMASIASVAEVEIVSAVEGENAYSIKVKGGDIGEITEASRSVGTTITVSNLFYNTPARLKFVRKAKNELHYITSLMQRLALANPDIVLEYVNETGKVLTTDGDGLLSAMSAVYGDEVIDKTIEIDVEEYGMRMSGFVSSTTYPRPTRSNQTFIVNGRIVTNVALVTALNNVYNDYFVKRYYPFAVLCLKVDPSEIDVNVHPTKAEIKFEYQSKVFGFVQRNLSKKLEDSLKENSYSFGELGGVVDDAWRKPFVADVVKPREEVKKDNYEPLIPSTLKQDLSSKVSQPKTFSPAITENISFDDFEEKDEEEGTEVSEKVEKVEQVEMFDTVKEGVDFKYAGQLFGTYIILEYKDDALIVDQHAAAEFTLYSKLKKQVEDNGLMIQPLMLPYDFSVDEQDSPAFAEKLDALKKIGVEIINKSGNDYSLVSLPLLLVNMNVDVLVTELIQSEREDLPLKEKLMSAACKAAIKGNTYMDEEGVRAFMINTFKDGIKPKCPHGRPAFTVVSKKDLEKMFMRVC